MEQVSIRALALVVTAVNAATVSFTTFPNGDCTGAVTTSYYGPNGGGNTCHVFGGASFGAYYYTDSDNVQCTFKSWENADCTGLATTRARTVDSGFACQHIANDNAGNFHVSNGLRSVSITCVGL
ncbi:hypothetical protein TWF694_005293 [Orbilia ellipsospora]|uniref:Uncharacterized protein n=1 Tax=Orbilia ellipsospora TaxID=2528407 RepID=A0AAV9WV60_9PEZI